MIDLTPEEWKLVSLGNYEELRKKDLNSETLQFLDICVANLSDKEAFKKHYGYQKDCSLNFPPEYLAGFNLDNRLGAILELIKKYNAQEVLDIGSRAGYLLFAGVKKCIIKSAAGVEIDTSYYNLCQRAKHLFNFHCIEFYNSLFEDFFTENKFDAVTITDVLEHTRDPDQIIKRTRDFIKSTGVLIISVPIDRPPVTADEVEKIISLGRQEHLHFFTPDQLKTLVEGHGYEWVESTDLLNSWLINISVFKPTE